MTEVQTHPTGERMLRWFAYTHLPAHLATISAPFAQLAGQMCSELASGPERTVMLRKLLEAKDAAVRAKLEGTPT
jgi:hypothetical protein